MIRDRENIIMCNVLLKIYEQIKSDYQQLPKKYFDELTFRILRICCCEEMANSAFKAQCPT